LAGWRAPVHRLQKAKRKPDWSVDRHFTYNDFVVDERACTTAGNVGPVHGGLEIPTQSVETDRGEPHLMPL
jgi:hypothetical protein